MLVWTNILADLYIALKADPYIRECPLTTGGGTKNSCKMYPIYFAIPLKKRFRGPPHSLMTQFIYVSMCLVHANSQNYGSIESFALFFMTP